MKKMRTNYLNNQVRKALDDFNERHNLGYDKLDNFGIGKVEDELIFDLYLKIIDNNIIIIKRALSRNNFTLKNSLLTISNEISKDSRRLTEFEEESLNRAFSKSLLSKPTLKGRR